MGSFNVRCAVSHQIIQEGEPAALLPLVENTHVESGITIYHNDIYTLATGALLGTYDGYGRLTDMSRTIGLEDVARFFEREEMKFEDIETVIQDFIERYEASSHSESIKALREWPSMFIKRSIYDRIMSDSFQDDIENLEVENVYVSYEDFKLSHAYWLDYIKHHRSVAIGMGLESDMMRFRTTELSRYIYRYNDEHPDNPIPDEHLYLRFPVFAETFSRLSQSPLRRFGDDLEENYKRFRELYLLDTTFSAIGAQIQPSLYSRTGDNDYLRYILLNRI